MKSTAMPENKGEYDIICLTLTRWDAPISSASLSLCKEFARNHRVFYIDHPYSWKDYFKQRNTSPIRSRKKAWRKSNRNIYTHPSFLPPSLTVVTPPRTLPINFLPAGKVYNALSAVNDRILFNTIRQVIRDHHVEDFVFINFFDPYFVTKMPADIKPFRTVYQCMDDISQVPYSARHGEKLEEDIIRNFDYTICTSKELTRLKSVFSPNVHFHPNAADIDIFKKAVTQRFPKPADLQSDGKKVIGFTGSIEYRTDFKLLKKIAAAHQDKILFMIGPIDTTEHIEAGLTALPNVVFAGPRNINELPPYLQHFDCVIIPFKKTVLTKSIYPLKINEYLAAARPVIATNFSEDICLFNDVVYIADSDEAFIQLIDKAIAEDGPARQEQQTKIAEQNTWPIRIKQFWEIISPEPVRN